MKTIFLKKNEIIFGNNFSFFLIFLIFINIYSNFSINFYLQNSGGLSEKILSQGALSECDLIEIWGDDVGQLTKIICKKIKKIFYILLLRIFLRIFEGKFKFLNLISKFLCCNFNIINI